MVKIRSESKNDITINLEAISSPYREMLDKITSASNSVAFQNFVLSRWKTETSAMQAEIKAIFELFSNGYKPSVVSSESSFPEAVFKVAQNDDHYDVILEVASVGWLFYTNEETKKFINKQINVKAKSEFDRVYPDKSLRISKQLNGVYVIGKNADLNKKVQSIYSKKRSQHKAKFPDSNNLIRIYYFVIESPIYRLGEVNLEMLQIRMKSNEVIFLCAKEGRNSRLVQSTIKIIKKSAFVPSFTNEYIETVEDTVVYCV